MDTKKKDPKDLTKHLEAQEQAAKEPHKPDEDQEKQAKEAREAQVREGGEQKVSDEVQDSGATKETQEAKEANETPLGEQKATEGTQKATEGEKKAAEGEKKAAEGEKKAAEGEKKGGAEGKAEEKAAVGTTEQKSGGGAGGVDVDSVRWTPTDANNASVQSTTPPSFQQSETILNASQTAADSQPVTSTQTAKQGGQPQPGWASKVVSFAGKTLQSAFLGNFALWDPEVRGKLHKAFADWSDFSKAKGLDKVIAFMDHAYGIVDAILGFIGPLGVVLGIVSYARYIPIPPIPAIGSALFVVSEVLKAINFVLEIVRAVIALLRPILTVVAMCTTKDPQKRKQYQERLTTDLIDFASSGFTVVMSGVTDRGFWKGFSEARKGGAGVLRSIGKGYGGLFRDKWNAGFGTLIHPNRARDLYRSTLEEALSKAVMGRTLVTYRQQVSGPGQAPVKSQVSTRAAQHGEFYNRPGAPDFQQLNRIGSRATPPGTVLSQTGRTTTNAAGQVIKQDIFVTEVGKGFTRNAGRVREVLVGPASNMVFGGSVLGEAVQATGISALSSFIAPPEASPPVTPQVQAHVDQAAKTTEQSLKNNQTPLLKSEPMPPKQTPSAPDHLKSVQVQREVMKNLSKEAEIHVAAAKAGQEEGKALIEVAKRHRKGADHAKAEVANHQQGLQKEQQEVRKGRQKVQEGIKQQQKGKEGFGKVEREGSRAKGVVPGGRVDRNEIPWYKRMYLWVVDKFEGAKAKVTEAMTGVVMKAVQGATGFQDVGQEVQQADQQTQQQEQVLSQEPAVVQKVQTVAQKEAQAAMEGEQKGQQRIAENQKAEAAGQQVLSETKKQEAALQKEEQQVKADAAKYEGTYGPSFQKLNQHADAAQAGDLTPLEIRLNQEIAALQEAVSKLLAAIAQHHAQMDTAVNQHVGKFRQAAEKLPGERGAQAVVQAEALGAQFRGQAAQAKAERTQQAEGLIQRAQAFGGKAADVPAIESVSKLLGEAVGQARDFDQQKQSELDQIHQAFKQQYEALFQ